MASNIYIPSGYKDIFEKCGRFVYGECILKINGDGEIDMLDGEDSVYDPLDETIICLGDGSTHRIGKGMRRLVKIGIVGEKDLRRPCDRIYETISQINKVVIGCKYVAVVFYLCEFQDVDSLRMAEKLKKDGIYDNGSMTLKEYIENSLQYKYPYITKKLVNIDGYTEMYPLTSEYINNKVCDEIERLLAKGIIFEPFFKSY